MKVTPRELILFLATAGVALFGGTALLARPRLEAWKGLRRTQAELRQEIAADRRLIESRAVWDGEFEKLKTFLPQFPAAQQMDVHWLTMMDEVAALHGVHISKRQVGEEKRTGDIYELPIEVRDWDGTLDALVHFLFELQQRGAMLDIRQLFMKPNETKQLRGRFVLYCAYTRVGGGSASDKSGQPGEPTNEIKPSP